MSSVPSLLLRRIAAVASGLVLLLSFVLLAASAVRAQDSGSGSAPAQPRDETKTFVNENGMQTIDRSLETEKRKTKDGEVEIQRYRAPG